MGAKFSVPREQVKESWRRSWLRLRGASDGAPQQPQRLEIMVTRTVTQYPNIPPSSHAGECIAAKCPSLLTINSEAGLSPSDSPTGAALGIPAEHILDETPSGFDGSTAIPGTQYQYMAIPSSPTYARHDDSDGHSNPFEENSMNESMFSSIDELIAAESPRTDARPRDGFSSSPTVVYDQNETRHDDDPDAIRPVTPPDQKMARFEERVAQETQAIDRPAGDQSTCYFCGERYLALGEDNNLIFREYKAYLVCGHIFGHRCLYNWMTSAQHVSGSPRCPHNCIALRHNCTHLTTPVVSNPEKGYHDASTSMIPWAYKFCETRKGTQLRMGFERAREMERGAEMNAIESRQDHRRGLRKAVEVLRRRRVPFAERIYTLARLQRLRTEKKLRGAQAMWWSKTWEECWGVEANIIQEG